MFCQKCGAQIPDNVTACSACSTVVAAAAPNPATVAAERVKAASKDALQAFKLFASNPVGGLSGAFESLGQARALTAGITFGVAFALCVLFAAYRVLPVWGRPQGFTGFIKILVVSVVPFVSLLGASTAARKAFRGEGGFGHDSFIAGASSLPFGCVALLAAILGLGNIEVIALFTLFAVCVTILMLFAGLTRICKTSERAATLAVPLMLIASAWLSKVIYAALLKEL
jgi:hypothetical protein